ncbi:MAG: hypothetical protein PHT60_05950 [Acidiphilium sp.]|nr:hypothetical protein [Acidiphilium sp.]MDD4935306.1 hypothetical protein [Acidiphilium sp.]
MPDGGFAVGGGQQGGGLGFQGGDLGVDEAAQDGRQIGCVAEGEEQIAQHGHQCAEASGLGFGQGGRGSGHAVL